MVSHVGRPAFAVPKEDIRAGDILRLQWRHMALLRALAVGMIVPTVKDR